MVEPTGLDYITYTNKIKYAFVALLRQGFASSLTPDDFKYDNVDPNKTKVTIHTAFPRKILKLPAIIISAEAGDNSVRFLQDDMLEPVLDSEGNEVGYLFGGPLELGIRVTIFSYSTFEREKLIDLCALYIRIVYKTVLKSYGVEITGIRIGGETQSEVDEKVVYENSLVIDTHSEIQYTLSTEDMETLNKINLEIDIINIKNEIEQIREIEVVKED